MRKAILPLLFAVFLFTLAFPSVANADDWDKKTIVTFNQDVAIPGQVLPAGTYVFKLLHSGSDRFVVQIWTAHEEQLVTSLLTAGDSYPNPSGDAYFVLDMSGTDEGYPPAVASWFFAGGDEGRDFIYSGYSTSRLVSDQDTSYVVPATDSTQVGVGVAITNPPPALPVYDQPVCPGDGYVWTPGYWAWANDSNDYYWVPGTWVLAPEVGLLWTPGYWGWGGDAFLWHEGYWGPQVGFYGGIDYGFGYFGVGFVGGRWDNGRFLYNRAVSNVNLSVTRNVYNQEVTNVNANRVSFNGGNGGIDARPTPQEEAAAHDRHVPPVAAQVQHVQTARANPELRASVNLGRPAIAATPRPGAFGDAGVLRANDAGAPYNPPVNRAVAANRADLSASQSTPLHAKDLPAIQRPAAPNTGDAKLDKKYMEQQDELVAKQEVERQQLQRQQDKEHQKLAKQRADNQQIQQLEQQHHQQTQQMAQRHSQEMQDLQRAQQPPRQTALKSRQ